MLVNVFVNVFINVFVNVVRQSTAAAASCTLVPTSGNRFMTTGRVDFVDDGNGGIVVTLKAVGVPNGNHTFHVHVYGDISDPVGNAVTGHFVGVCNSCRPAGAAQEVGLLNNGSVVVATGNTLSYSYTDYVIALSGVNSIVGRSVVVHGNGTTAGALTRIAQCVIGVQNQPTPGECTPRRGASLRVYSL